MKFCYLPCMLFIFFAASCKIQHLDKKEYGYKGRVKKISIATNLADRAWQASFNQYFFNKNGNLDSAILEVLVPISGYNFRNAGTYNMVNGQRLITERDERGWISQVTQHWQGRHQYELLRTRHNRPVTKEIVSLNKNFREISRYTYRYQGDTLQLVKADYFQLHPKSGRIESMTTKEFEEGKTRKEFLKYKDFDKKGNPLAITVKDSTGKDIYHKVYNYDYY